MRAISACMAMCLFAGWLHAQGVTTPSDWAAVQKLVPGTNVRVAAGSRQLTGTVQSATDTTLTVLNQFRDSARFDRGDVDLVEELFGSPHPKRRGAVKGALWSSLLAIPATISTEMGGMERKYLPLTYCMIICTGAAIGAWTADPPQSRVVYRR